MTPDARLGPPPRTTGRAAAAVVSALCVAMLLSACGFAGSSTDESPRAAPSSETSSDASSPSTSPTPTEPTEAPLTQAEQWRENFLSSEDEYSQAVAAAAGTVVPVAVMTRAALTTCNLLVDGKPLDRRLGRVVRAFAGAAQLSLPQALAFIDATVDSVCPDVSTLHVAQKSEARRLARVARVAREKAAAATARREAREARQERLRQEQAAPPASATFYANCTEVEAAGAAPIYAGDPGYSGDLDRDGDGVACET